MNEDLPNVEPEEKELQKMLTKWKKRGFEMNDNSEMILLEDKTAASQYNIDGEEFHSDYIRYCQLKAIIESGHAYHFVGKAGLFCPMKPGSGGGLLVRENNGKFSFAGGAKGYRWMEAEMVKAFGKQDDIDISYYDMLADKAVAAIDEYGDFETFAE
jgi:hypothetical protein